MNPTSAGVWANRVALALAAAASVVVVLAPLQRSESVVIDTAGRRAVTSSSENLLATQGWWIVALAALPVVVAGLPLVLKNLESAAHRVATIAAAALLLAFVVLTGFSIGLLYAPAAMAMLVSAAIVLSSAPRRADAEPT